jgi:hypothetical protein
MKSASCPQNAPLFGRVQDAAGQSARSNQAIYLAIRSSEELFLWSGSVTSRASIPKRMSAKFSAKLFPLLVVAFLSTATPRVEGQSQQNQSFVEMTECQGVNNCATWTLHRRKGIGEWPSGERAVLEITSLDSGHITITRTDFEGPTKGLEATYEGTAVEDGDLGGTFQSNYNGQHHSGHWYMQQAQVKSSNQQTSRDGLQQIVECEGRGCNISAPTRVSWIFNGKKEGTGIFSTGNQPLTIGRFDSNTIVVTRTDTSGPWRGSAIYTGHISGDQIQGTVEYHDPGRSTPRYDVWTGLIGTTPIAEGSPQVAAPSAEDMIHGLQILNELIKMGNNLQQ